MVSTLHLFRMPWFLSFPVLWRNAYSGSNIRDPLPLSSSSPLSAKQGIRLRMCSMYSKYWYYHVRKYNIRLGINVHIKGMGYGLYIFVLPPTSCHLGCTCRGHFPGVTWLENYTGWYTAARSTVPLRTAIAAAVYVTFCTWYLLNFFHRQRF